MIGLFRCPRSRENAQYVATMLAFGKDLHCAPHLVKDATHAIFIDLYVFLTACNPFNLALMS